MFIIVIIIFAIYLYKQWKSYKIKKLVAENKIENDQKNQQKGKIVEIQDENPAQIVKQIETPEFHMHEPDLDHNSDHLHKILKKNLNHFDKPKNLAQKILRLNTSSMRSLKGVFYGSSKEFHISKNDVIVHYEENGDIIVIGVTLKPASSVNHENKVNRTF